MPIDISNMIVNIGHNNPKTWIDVSSALLTPLVAIIMAYIAWQQWRTGERKRRQELFEMRYENLFLLILNDSNRYDMEEKEKFENLNSEEIEQQKKEFNKQLHKYKFLIKQSDFDKLMSLHDKLCSTLISEHLAYNDLNDIERPKKLISIYKNLGEIYGEMDEIMGNYLRVEEEAKNLWQLLVNFFVKSHYFLAIDKIIDFFRNKFRKNKKQEANNAD